MTVRIVDTLIAHNLANDAALTFSDEGDAIYVLKTGAVRNPAVDGIGLEMGGAFQNLSISGSVIGGAIGVYLNVGAFDSEVTVERGAFVSSLQSNADAIHLRNNGSIGFVEFNGENGQTNRFENTGVVDRFLGSDAADEVSNAGVIPFVNMGGGDDIYDGSASHLSHVEIHMGEGEDTAIGSRYGETIDGGNGDDVVRASGGDDRVLGGFGSDQLDGGPGVDTFDAFDADNASIINLGTGLALSVSPVFGAIAEDTLIGFEDVAAGFLDDTLFGSAAANTLDGLPGNDFISGLGGDDRLIGGPGDDSLSGGPGRDLLSGSEGRDVLNGGAGADRFIYYTTKDSIRASAGRDVIAGFAQGEDRIDFSRIEAEGISGSFPFKLIGTQPFGPASPGEARYQLGNGSVTYLYLNTDNDAASESVIQISGHINFTADDFIL